MNQTWRVFTVEGTNVVSTLWTESGPQESKVTHRGNSVADAAETAVILQGEYDRLRSTMPQGPF